MIKGPLLGRDGLITQLVISAVSVLVWGASFAVVWPHQDRGAFVAGAVGALIALLRDRSRNADYWTLPAHKRQQIRTTLMTGRPSGDPTLDAIAHRRLSRAAATYPGGLLLVVVVLTGMLAVPIVAAVEVNPLWVLVAIGLAIPLVRPVAAAARSPEAKIRRLESAG